MSFAAKLRCWLLVATASFAAVARGDDEYERPPIDYSRATPDNCISQLQARLDAGEAKLPYAEQAGYLPALLELLGVPVESQMLVFSKTSLQRHRITPRTPRAIYFNDNVYIGYCHAGDVLEISAVDSQLGAVFYTLDQRDQQPPRFARQTDNCLLCHASSRTDYIPGHTVRSMFVDTSGQPIFSAGSYTVDHTTPLAQRWGGWYVTGEHGAQTHLGNLIIQGQTVQEPVDNAQGQNVTTLGDRLKLEKYLSPHSDLVALMVFEHQTLVHNRLTRASYVPRQALHYQAELNQALGEPAWNRLESTGRRIESAGKDLVDALLLVDEVKLTAPIKGTSSFAEKFAAAGPRDSRGRSLRDLDLQQRLFRYPCSYLIYSPAFDALHDEMKAYVWQRLWDVLMKSVDAEKYAHLSPADRQAIVEIIAETKPGLPDYWKPTK